MTRDDIIRMAREAEGESNPHGMWRMHMEDLERFANLVAEAERKSTMLSGQIASPDERLIRGFRVIHYDNGVVMVELETKRKINGKFVGEFEPHIAHFGNSVKFVNGDVDEEREACARVCDGDGVRQLTGDECAAAIRARGERD